MASREKRLEKAVHHEAGSRLRELDALLLQPLLFGSEKTFSTMRRIASSGPNGREVYTVKQVDDGLETSTYWRDADLHDLEFLSARFVRHQYALHTHETFVLGVVEEGAARFSCGGRVHVCSAGTIMVINPGDPHTGESAAKGGYRYRMIYPSPGLVSSALGEDSFARLPPGFRQPVVRDRRLASLIRDLHDAAVGRDSALAKQSLLTEILSDLVATYAPPVPFLDRAHPREELRRVRESLTDRLDQNLPLADLAREAGLSPFHLLRSFRREFGLPPHAYQRQARIERAKALLRDGVSLVDAALLVGFSDQSHLTRWFKRTLGITPAQFARA